MRSVGEKVLVAVVLSLVAGCGGSSGTTNNTPPPSGITIDPAVSTPLAANLSGLATTLTGTAPLALGAAVLALEAGVQATRAKSASASLAPELGRSPALNGGTTSPLLFGVRITVLNAPPGGPNQILTGVAAFEDAMHFAIVAGPVASGSTPVPIPPAEGVYVAGSTNPLPVWLASAGEESAQLQQTSGSCLSVIAPLAPFVTACSFATFSSSSVVEITASTPIANGATGSQTTNGLLSVSSALYGAAITIDCGQSSLPSWLVTACQAIHPVGVSVTISPTAATLPPGGTQQFTSTVTGASNPAVTWAVQEQNGGSISTTGLYTAPATTGGPFHVVATSAADSTKSATATVTVSSASGPGAVFVVDATGHLFAFDGNGNLQSKVLLPGTVGDINGGEVALANGNVYVTLGQPTNQVVAYTQTSLTPVSLPAGAFSGLFVPRGIAYDTNLNRFYVGNGGSTVTVYDQNGASVTTTGGFPGHYGPSGMAFDAENDSIWTANYAGYAGASYGVADYGESGGAAQTFDLTHQFVSPDAHTEPYSIAFCPGACAGKVWVGFIDDGSHQGTPVVAGYGTDGTSSGVTFPVTKPYQLAIDAQTYVWVADKDALYKYGLGQGSQTPAGFTASLTPPIFGVATLAGTPSAAVTISPSSITLAPGASQQLSATVAWSSNPTVSWSVQETNGGSVSTAGLYTAPATVGTFHVVATSVADSSRSAVATVNVAVPGSTFVVDSTGYLLSFDANGAPLTKAKLPGTVGDINGGEVALANGNVYVTLGNPTNRVVAYTQAGLGVVTLPTAAFSGLFVPRGIAFDSHAQRFYVGNGGAGVNVYDQNGVSVTAPGGFPGRYGPSGVAFDGNDDTLWVANYAGYVGAPYGTAEYNEDGSVTRTFDVSKQFVAPYPSSQPYAIAWCEPCTTSPKVWIGFIDDGSGRGTPIVQAYDADGGVAAGYQLPMVKPYQVSFDSVGNLWVADKGGIWLEGPGGNIAPAAMKAALTPPIYGVAAR